MQTVAPWCRSLAAAVIGGLAAAHAAQAADPRYPDWPCQQLKVPHISVAAVWSGPPIGGLEGAAAGDPELRDLAARLAARRTPMEAARKMIGAYVTGSPTERAEKAKRLFAALYDTLNAQRQQVMDGLERFSRKQKALADDIRASIDKMHALQDSPNGDRAQVDELSTRLQWETRIFSDRQKTTAYACEVPTIIERRLFELARAIQAAAAAS